MCSSCSASSRSARQVRTRVAMNETVHGADYPEVARALGNLGTLLQEQGDVTAHAVPRARACDKRTGYGPEHPEVAITLSSSGIVLQRQSDLAKARAALERALAINVAIYDPAPRGRAYARQPRQRVAELGELDQHRRATTRARDQRRSTDRAPRGCAARSGTSATCCKYSASSHRHTTPNNARSRSEGRCTTRAP